MATMKQLKTLSKIFKRSGRTFQRLAKECGLEHIPDHVDELSEYQASKLIERCGMFLIEHRKEKQ